MNAREYYLCHVISISTALRISRSWKKLRNKKNLSAMSLKTSISASRETNWWQRETVALKFYRTLNVKANPNWNNTWKMLVQHPYSASVILCLHKTNLQLVRKVVNTIYRFSLMLKNMITQTLENFSNMKDENCLIRSHYTSRSFKASDQIPSSFAYGRHESTSRNFLKAEGSSRNHEFSKIFPKSWGLPLGSEFIKTFKNGKGH